MPLNGIIVILPEVVSCNGTLISWDGCAVSTNPSVRTRMLAGVYRPAGDDYERIALSRINVDMQQSSVDDYTCFSRGVQIQVQVGDRIFAATRSNCSNAICPLNPFVNMSSDIVSYIPFTASSTIRRSSFRNISNVGINLRASISTAGLGILA